MPPRSAALEKRVWSMRWEVVTYVEFGGYEYKRIKMQENQRQGCYETVPKKGNYFTYTC